MPLRVWFDDMGEVSGLGGEYEAACRRMVLAAASWIDRHPNAELSFEAVDGVFGLVRGATDESRALMDEMAWACGTGSKRPSGAMMHAAVMHALCIQKHGWDAYCLGMRRSQT